MELKEFISETLNHIIDGVNAAQEHARVSGARINPRVNAAAGGGRGVDIGSNLIIDAVKFDVALTAAKDSKTKGGIAVFFGAVGLGSQGESKAANESVNRVSFSVPIILPPQAER